MRRFGIGTILLLCLMLPSNAGAGAPREFYGVIAASDPDSTEIARMGAGRVGTLRVNFVWGAVQPTESGPFDWGHYDLLIAAAARQGIRALPTVYGSPPWAAARPNHPPSKGHRAEFRDFVRAAAARYGSNGTFWTAHPEIPKLPVVWWQLWNEVNAPSFWYSKPNPRQYASLLRVFSAGIRSGDPDARIALAGLFRTPRVKHGIPLVRYLPALYRAKAKRLFDAVAIHPYATTPKQALQAMRDTRRIMSRFKDSRAKLWVTEIGWATGGVRTALTVSPHRQASYLRKSFRLLAANRKRLRIAGVVWYSWRDVPGGIWFNHTGLFTQGFDPKPAWGAFTALTGGSAAAPRSAASRPLLGLP